MHGQQNVKTVYNCILFVNYWQIFHDARTLEGKSYLFTQRPVQSTATEGTRPLRGRQKKNTKSPHNFEISLWAPKPPHVYGCSDSAACCTGNCHRPSGSSQTAIYILRTFRRKRQQIQLRYFCGSFPKVFPLNLTSLPPPRHFDMNYVRSRNSFLMHSQYSDGILAGRSGVLILACRKKNLSLLQHV